MLKKEWKKVSFEIQDTEEEEEETVKKTLKKNAQGEYISRTLLMAGIFMVGGVVSLGLEDIVKRAVLIVVIILALSLVGTVSKKSYETRCSILGGSITDENRKTCTLLDAIFNLGVTLIILGILAVSLLQLI